MISMTTTTTKDRNERMRLHFAAIYRIMEMAAVAVAVLLIEKGKSDWIDGMSKAADVAAQHQKFDLEAVAVVVPWWELSR